MEVKRQDIFVFSLELDESNFARLKVESDKVGTDIESVLALIITSGIDNFSDIEK